MGLKDCTEEISEIHQSVESVILTNYDIVKAHGGEIKVETKEDEARPAVQSNHPGGDNRAGREQHL